MTNAQDNPDVTANTDATPLSEGITGDQITNLLKLLERKVILRRAVEETVSAIKEAMTQDGESYTSLEEYKLLIAMLQDPRFDNTDKEGHLLRPMVIKGLRGLSRACFTKEDARAMAKFFNMYAQALDLQESGLLGEAGVHGGSGETENHP